MRKVMGDGCFSKKTLVRLKVWRESYNHSSINKIHWQMDFIY